MRKEERDALLERARNERTRKKGVRKLQGTATERATAGEFGAEMSPSMTDREKAVASKRGNIRDIRYTGTDAKNKVFKASQKKKTDDKRAAATRAAVKSMPKKDPRGNQIKATPGAAKKKETKKFNVGVSKGGVSFKEAFKHYRGLGQASFTWNGKKYTTDVKKAKPKAKISTPKPADFTIKKAAPTKPKGGESKAKTKSRNLTLRDKGGVRSKTRLPAGAKKFTGTYNSKTHKLQNINGKTYVVPRGK